MSSKKEIPNLDYIAGIVSCSGSFIFVQKNNKKIPVFQIKLKQDEYQLLRLVKEKLQLKERVYKYEHKKKKYTLLIIRSKKTIENTIIPAFEYRLFGSKEKQFEKWKKITLQNILKQRYG